MGPFLHRGFPAHGSIAGAVTVTIGVFDGVHLGHQELLRRTAELSSADGARALVTFDPHPRCVLDPGGCPPMLSAVDERRDRAYAFDVEHTVAVEFTHELSEWSAEHFCDRLLDAMDVHAIVVGSGFALGHARGGDESFLRAYANAHEFDVVVVPPVLLDGARVTSTRVRSALAEGDVGRAAALLGRNYTLPGIVVAGDRRGRTLGFPTANVEPPPSRCVPGAGVYATWLLLHGRWHAAATSIGVRPTFGGTSTTIESFVLDLDESLYGETVTLEFVQRLREERAYPDSDSLVAQMRDDVAEVRALLAERTTPVST